MITVVAKSVIKEEMLEQYKALAQELVEKSRKEEGCISYNLNQDINDKTILTFIEEWKDKEALDLHNSSAHFTTILPKLAAMKDKQSEINLYVRL